MGEKKIHSMGREERRMKYWIIGDEFLDEEPKREADAQGYLKELIRCRDCKHRTHNGTCIKNMKRKLDDGYCDEGERNEW